MDLEKKIVHAQAGILIEELNQQLAAPAYNLALPTQGSHSSVSLVGALATSTKGTGTNFQCLSSYVEEFTIILSNGLSKNVKKQENEDLFHDILCGLGCFGMITSIKVRCVQLEQLQDSTESVLMSKVIEDFSHIMHSAPRVRIWWIPLDGRACISRISSISLPQSASKEHSWFRRRLIGYYLHQILLYLCIWFPSLTPYVVRLLYSQTKNIPQQKIGNQTDVLPMDCLYSQRTAEWSIPFEQAIDALKELHRLFSTNTVYEMNGMIEIRSVRSDRFPLSPAYNDIDGQLYIDIGLLQYCPFCTTEPNLPFNDILSKFCSICQRYGGRFHWAKEISSDIQGINDIKRIWGNQSHRIDHWLKSRNEIDPAGLFWTKRLAKLFSENECY